MCVILALFFIADIKTKPNMFIAFICLFGSFDRLLFACWLGTSLLAFQRCAGGAVGGNGGSNG